MTARRGRQSDPPGHSASEWSGDVWVVYLCAPGKKPMPCAVVRSNRREAAAVIAQERLFERGVVLAFDTFLQAVSASECPVDDVRTALQADALPTP